MLIDGDHSYEGCKNDILYWSPFLVEKGVIAIHDYGNVSEGTKYSEIVKAVYDEILFGGKYSHFDRVDTLFIARKQSSNSRIKKKGRYSNVQFTSPATHPASSSAGAA